MDKSVNHIILVGFMGSGKSTIARHLARRLNMSSLDMDSYIQNSSGLTVAQIFATEGEAGFRARETKLLQTMFTRDRMILSCGGGVISSKVNRDLLKQLGWVVYLKVDAAVAKSRIENTDSRPLFGSESAVAELLASREKLYLEVADICIDTNDLGIAQVTQQVIESLRTIDQL